MGALEGRTVVVTRARHQAGEFTGLLRERGATAVAIPTIEIVGPETWEPVDEALGRVGRYHWLVLTSVNGASFFLRRAAERLGSAEALRGLKICAVGPKTRAAVEKEGLRVDFVPEEHVAEGVVGEGGEARWRGRRVLFPRAAEGREVIPEGLRGLGAEVDVVTVYRNVPPPASASRFREVLRGEADAVAFTSGSTVRNFAALFEEGEAAGLLEGVAVACIGPATAAAAGALGIRVDVMPETYTVAALVDALERHFEKAAGREAR